MILDYGGWNETKTFTGATFLVNALVSVGVTHVFGGHGGAVVPLIDAIDAHPDITWVYCRCEVNASQMAMAYAKYHRGKRPGCCVATSGPGAAHLLSGLVDADQDRVPVLCITGMKNTAQLRHADFQDIDQASIFRMAGLILSEIVADIDQLLPLTRNAVTMAITSNRCAHLAVPINVQQAEVTARTTFCLGNAYKMRNSTPASDLEIGVLIMALRTEIESKRHVLIACGYRAHSVGAEIERLAELLHAPILTSYDGKGVVDESHPLSFGVVGVYGNAGTPSSISVLDDCETVIDICGTDLTELVSSKSGLQIRRLIQIDERLVASDSMRFATKAIFSCAHLKISLQKVIKGLESSLSDLGKGVESENLMRKSSILTTVDAKRISRRLSSFSELDSVSTYTPESSQDIFSKLLKEDFVKPSGTPSTFLEMKALNQADLNNKEYCHPATFFNVMKDHLETDAAICADIGDNALWMASCLAAKRGQIFLTSEHMGIMGMGLNAGLAASLSKSSQTLVVAGDGGLQMSLNELATFRDHRARNVLVVVIVNKRLGRVQNENWGATLKADGCSIGSPDYVKLFDAYGYPNGTRISTSDTEMIKETIVKGWALAGNHGCSVIELHQDPHVHPIMHKLDENKQTTQSADPRSNQNKNNQCIFPSIKVPMSQSIQESVADWMNNSLSGVEKSKASWIKSLDVASFSPSKIMEELLLPSLSLFQDKPLPALFENEEDYKIFDDQFKSSMLNAFPIDVTEEILSNCSSNGHPLCLQLLAVARGLKFPPHAHPNIELDIPLVGELYEKRVPGCPLPAFNFRRTECIPVPPLAEHLENMKTKLAQPGACVFLNSDDIMDRCVSKGQVLYNPTGSIHQSFTKDNGVLILALWSGVHSNYMS